MTTNDTLRAALDNLRLELNTLKNGAPRLVPDRAQRCLYWLENVEAAISAQLEPPPVGVQPPEVRLDGDELDELVGDGSFHLENMDTNLWWMELRNPAGAVAVWLRARGKITAHYERRDGSLTETPKAVGVQPPSPLELARMALAYAVFQGGADNATPATLRRAIRDLFGEAIDLELDAMHSTSPMTQDRGES